MLERIKTLLLITLVAASIGLSLVIWQGLPPPAAATNSPPAGGTFWGPGVDAIELMAPTRIIVHLGEGKHAMLYPETALFNLAWRPALDALQQLGGYRGDQLKWQPLNGAQWQEAQGGPGLELVFAFPVDTTFWGQVLGYDQLPAAHWPVKRMLFRVEPEPQLLLASSTGDTLACLKLPSGGTDLAALFQQLATRELPPYVQLTDRPASPLGLFLPEHDLSYPVLKTSGEEVEPKVVAGSFFADLSLTRCINERDGATIYSDGRRGVRVWPEGRVEYSAPEVLYGVRLPSAQALQRAIRFVTQHGGWLYTMRLARLQEITTSEGQVFYRLAFRQYEHGLPLASPQVELELSDRGVASYRREICSPSRLGRSQTLSATAAAAGLAALTAKGESVVDVYPGYVLEQTPELGAVLSPTWLAELADARVVTLKLPNDDGGGSQ